ncbi:MAG: hypothetical protein QXO70_03235 [Candidatus Pacearchaeota archaeon]
MKARTIIALTAYQGSGKDTAANYLCNCFNFSRIAFADQLRTLVKEKYKFTDQQLDHPLKDTYLHPTLKITPREAMIKTASFFRKFDDDYFVHHVEFSMEGKENIVITDLRFSNEEKFLRKLNTESKVIVIRIDRKSTKTEKSVDEIKYDYKINNDNSIFELYSELNKILQSEDILKNTNPFPALLDLALSNKFDILAKNLEKIADVLNKEERTILSNAIFEKCITTKSNVDFTSELH